MTRNWGECQQVFRRGLGERLNDCASREVSVSWTHGRDRVQLQLDGRRRGFCGATSGWSEGACFFSLFFPLFSLGPPAWLSNHGLLVLTIGCVHNQIFCVELKYQQKRGSPILRRGHLHLLFTGGARRMELVAVNLKANGACTLLWHGFCGNMATCLRGGPWMRV